ncbi:MAG: exonuclease domain-containing protein [Lachnospiraceae bacterium]|nr:exonuclease domain-containing protein [Lachnospiraceae bacterium]
MNFIVLDLEWNQSSKKAEADRGLHFEIIEIGAVRLNESRAMIGEFSRLVKPQIYHELHKITSKLIHIQMQELEQGKPFPEVFKDFLTWCGEDYRFCTWGPLDLTQLQQNMQFYGLEPLTGGPIPFLDIQKLFSIAFEDGKSRRALEYAVDFLNLEKDIPFHRAFSDAYYAGKVLAAIPQKVCSYLSYDLFNPPKSRVEEVKVTFDTYAKYISRVFPDKAAMLMDKEVFSSKCYICNKNLKKRIRWFTPNGKHYYCVAYCDEHGLMKGKIRIRKAEGNEIYAVKTTKFIGEEDLEIIKERREHAREQRKKRKRRK